MLRSLLARAIPRSSSAAAAATTRGFTDPRSFPLLFREGSRLSTSQGGIGNGGGGGGNGGDGEEDDPFSFADLQKLPPDVARDVEAVVGAAEGFHADAARARGLLERCGATASEPVVVAVLARLRNSCAAAHAAFRWASAQPGYAPGRHACHSMLAILAKHRRFDDARALLDQMRRSSLASPAAVMLLIRRYCAARDVAGAVAAFRALPSLGFRPGVAEFHGLLTALCRYKNVQDAEHLLLSSEKEFPFETKSFNVVLNGWCNMVRSVREAKRFWNAMEIKGIKRDVVSYGSMISCFSKAGSLDTVMKLFNRMKEAGVIPDRKIYNAVVYALAKGRCVNEAKALVRSMEEKGVAPDTATFNSLIRPLCKARQVQEARKMLDDMLGRGLSPSVRTFHALLDVARSPIEVFDLLDKMKELQCDPEMDTFIMLIRKFCRWRQHDSVEKLWSAMPANGLSPDRSAYIVLIHGLFLNGRLEESAKYYEEMKAKGFPPEKKTEEMIQAWLSGRELAKASASVGSRGGSVSLRSNPRK
ncbi:pentatricopeptide repeat-containing protein At5g15010, mitochondrial-like [Oryza glaberrima]|uniref:Pentacotripeptide-repeat region of PRORP domain-containing protein n=1 Tax=Oryza glaberrima TaxID=4538 RepID=I1NSP3_ORYGL|nr:pentatricopeptide repeat-containing protein At5g15010, mitochondrial-like [Oryza glaberrima]XP_052155678.1 pentatricopeptide repeat-containing protein At5g15010, mitochondrial-like [Oryza glaberrima]